MPLLLSGPSPFPRNFFTQNYLFLAILAVTIYMRHLHRVSLKREIGLAFDLTAKERQLEGQVEERTAALVRASNEWRAAFDSMDDLMLLVDSGGLIVRVNLATALFWGRAPGNIVGVPAEDLLQQGGLGGGWGTVAAVQRTGRRAVSEVRHDPSGRWFLATVEPIPPGRAQAGGVVLDLRDISGMKAMECAVAEARDDWEETFDSIQEGITIHDADFRVLRANTAARRLLGGRDVAIEEPEASATFSSTAWRPRSAAAPAARHSAPGSRRP